MQQISSRNFLIILLVTLIVMVLILLYLYFLLNQPPGLPAVQSQQMQHLFSIYGYGTSEDELLYRPTDVAFDEDGNIFIADTGHARVLKFDSSGKFLRKFGKKGFGKGDLMEPVGISVSKDGQIFVADKALSKIVVFDDESGNVQSEFQVMMPIKPQIANGKLYLTTYAHVMIFNLNCEKLDEWGRRGKQVGEFDSPAGIAVDEDDNVYVSDTLNLRFQAFSKRNKLLWVRGKPAKDTKAEDRKFGLPYGVAIDDKNLLYVVDAFDSSIRVLDKKGNQIVVLGGKEGSREGQFYQPTGIAYDQNGVFAIADKFNDRVQVVRITVDANQPRK